MALIICPECSASVSEYTSNCPHCGFPIAQKYYIVASNISINTNLQVKFCNITNSPFSLTPSGAVSKKTFTLTEAQEKIEKLKIESIDAFIMPADNSLISNSSHICCPK